MDAIEYLMRAQAAYESRQFGEALAVIADAEAGGKACPELILLKGACIQLAEETDFPVEYALRAYDELLKRQPRNSRALLEKGFFLLNVLDNAASAKACFLEAAQLCAEPLELALSGLGQAAAESGESDQAVQSDIEARMDELVSRVRARMRLSK